MVSLTEMKTTGAIIITLAFFMTKPNMDITKVNEDLNKIVCQYKVTRDMKIMKKTLQEYEAAIGGKAELLSQGWTK